jgi:voltage-gated potassium channel
MDTTSAIPKEERSLGPLNLLIIVLSVYVLVQLFLTAIVKFDPETTQILDYIDNAICVVFIYDFFKRFLAAKNKVEFMKWGWIDLLSSIPMLDAFRAGRLFRLIRLIRVLRAFRSVKHLMSQIHANRAQGLLSTVLIITVLMLFFSSIAILQVEVDPNSNIKTAEDALWWACTTLTTVGYGDKYPVTTEGRIIAVILMVTGVAICGTFAGFVVSYLSKSEPSNNENIK